MDKKPQFWMSKVLSKWLLSRPLGKRKMLLISRLQDGNANDKLDEIFSEQRIGNVLEKTERYRIWISSTER